MSLKSDQLELGFSIENIIEVLNPNKASGDDGISHKILKGVSKSVSKPLCILMNIATIDQLRY